MRPWGPWVAVRGGGLPPSAGIITHTTSLLHVEMGALVARGARGRQPRRIKSQQANAPAVIDFCRSFLHVLSGAALSLGIAGKRCDSDNEKR